MARKRRRQQRKSQEDQKNCTCTCTSRRHFQDTGQTKANNLNSRQALVYPTRTSVPPLFYRTRFDTQLSKRKAHKISLVLYSPTYPPSPMSSLVRHPELNGCPSTWPRALDASFTPQNFICTRSASPCHHDPHQLYSIPNSVGVEDESTPSLSSHRPSPIIHY